MLVGDRFRDLLGLLAHGCSSRTTRNVCISFTSAVMPFACLAEDHSSAQSFTAIIVVLDSEADIVPFNETGSLSFKRGDEALGRQGFSVGRSQTVRFDLKHPILLAKIGEYQIELRRKFYAPNYLLGINPWIMSLTVKGELTGGRTVLLHKKEESFFGGHLWNAKVYSLVSAASDTNPGVVNAPESPQSTPTPTAPKFTLAQLVQRAQSPVAKGNAQPVATATKEHATPAPIKTLAVKVESAAGLLGKLDDLPDFQEFPGLVGLPPAGGMIGESDDVWLDLGPRAWRLGHKFPAGQEVTIDLDVSGLQLSEEDITQVRLEKKGILGFTNAPDNFFYGEGYFPSLVSEVAMLRKAVQEAQYAVSQAQSFLPDKKTAQDAANEAYKDATKPVEVAQDVLDKAVAHVSNLQNLEKELSQVVTELPTLPLKIPNPAPKVPVKIPTPLGDIDVDPLDWVSDIANPRIDQLKKKQKELTDKINALKSDGIDWFARKSAAEADLVTKKAFQAGKFFNQTVALVQYKVVTLQFDVAQEVLRSLVQKLGNLEELAAKLDNKLPSFQKDMPNVGQWKAQHVTVIVDGQEKYSYPIGDTLRHNHYAWIRLIGNMSAAERFARGLRIEPPKAGATEQQDVWLEIEQKPWDFFQHPDLLTTISKNVDISGWERYPVNAPHVPVGTARVIGKLIREPSQGTDANVSLDLEVEGVESEGRQFVLIDRQIISQARYIRIEYQFGTDRRFQNEGWHAGDEFDVRGEVRWDTDHSGFFEIHPQHSSDVTRLKRLIPK